MLLPSYGGSSSGPRVGAGWGGRPAANSYGSNQTTPSYGATTTSTTNSGGSGGQYANELSQLAGMGFNDRNKNVALLSKHKGNLQAAVAELL